jgi:hypothetical protein
VKDTLIEFSLTVVALLVALIIAKQIRVMLNHAGVPIGATNPAPVRLAA